jgi:hypothetical protein
VTVADERLCTVAHGQGEAEGAAGDPIWPLPGSNLGPEIGFHRRRVGPGLHRL